MKYRVDRPVADILEMLVKEVNVLDNEVRTKQTQYSQAQNSYLQLQKKQTGNLSQKSLSGIVKHEDVVLDSEYLETIFIAVPRNEERSFNAKYETLTPNVVPRSAQKLAQDDEFCLYSVTLFRRDIAEFSHRSRELKFPFPLCLSQTDAKVDPTRLQIQ
jgi:V-type H+-transporting ATPase subunit C